MADWPEQIHVRVVAPADLNMKASALRNIGESAWTIFVSAGNEDYWLAMIETLRVQPLHFDKASAEWYAKACLLLGEEWDDVWREMAEVRDFQRDALDGLGPRMRRRIDNSTTEEIREWRVEMETVEEGELLRAELTGEDPMQVRN
jgi:hypothetical protein